MVVPQKVLIFGGSGGVGSSLARMLHAEGASLFVAGRNTLKLESLADELGCRYGCVDASDPDAVDAMADQAMKSLVDSTELPIVLVRFFSNRLISRAPQIGIRTCLQTSQVHLDAFDLRDES